MKTNLIVLVGVLIASQISAQDVCPGVLFTPFQVLDPVSVEPGGDVSNGNMGHYTKVFGNTIIAGAYGWNTWRGAIYVYEKGEISGSSFAFKQRLTGTDTQPLSYLGLNIGMSNDFIIGGAPYSRPFGEYRSGSVYVYKKDEGGMWSQSQILIPYDSHAGGYFGYAVAIHKDTLVVGARHTHNQVTGVRRAGKAYFYKSTQNGWEFEQELRSTRTGTQWADEVRVVDDVMVLGAPRAYGDEGAAYFFVKIDGAWVEPAGVNNELRVISETIEGETIWTNPRSHFGEGLALSEDGTIMVVGGEKQASPYGWNTGAAQLYIRRGNEFVFQQHLFPDTGGGMRFAQRIVARNNAVVVGAWTYSEPGEPGIGSTFVYVRCDDGMFTLQETLVVANITAGANYGKCVDMSDQYFVAGAPKIGLFNASNAGSVFVYSIDGLPSNTPSPTPSPSPTPTPTPAPAPTDFMEHVGDFADANATLSLTAINRISIYYGSTMPDRDLEVRVMTSQGHFIEKHSIVAGIGIAHFDIAVRGGSPGDTVRVRAMMVPKGLDWLQRVLPGLFKNALLMS